MLVQRFQGNEIEAPADVSTLATEEAVVFTDKGTLTAEEAAVLAFLAEFPKLPDVKAKELMSNLSQTAQEIAEAIRTGRGTPEAQEAAREFKRLARVLEIRRPRRD